MEKNISKSKFWDNRIIRIIVSLLGAVLLWVIVTITVGDQITQKFDGVPVYFSGEDTLRETQKLVITDISHNTVSVTIKGTRRDIAKLSSENMTAVVDVSKITAIGNDHPGNFEISYPATVTASNLTRVSSSPLTVSFSVVRSQTKTIDVKGEFKGTIAEGYSQKPLEFNPETVKISGPESEISKVAYAWVVVDRENVSQTMTFDQSYILMDSEGKEVPLGNIKLERDTVSVTLSITATKEVPLTVDIVDGAGASAENIKISCVPETITIAGDTELVEGINKISLGTVDLASFGSTFEETFAIVLDNNITNVTGVTEAKVTIQVIGLETKKFNVTNISLTNLAAGLTGEVVTEAVEVILRGSAETLSQIKANNIRIVADMSELSSSKGEFEPPAKVYIDGFTGVGAIGKYSIYVKVT